MKHLSFFICTLLLLASCNKKQSAPVPQLTFTDDVRLSATPVKDQGHSSLCWLYAMLSTIETEHIMQGDSINLSVDYAARAYLREQALEDYAADRATITQRGMATTAMHLLETYGMTHFDAFHRRKDANLEVLCRQLQVAQGSAETLTDYMAQADRLLDNAFGQPSEHVFFLGAEYTPLEFAHSVCRDDEYEALTSFSHHPFGQRFALEVPDNHYHDTFLNVPIDTLFRQVVQAVKNGHAVCWEGDVSEPGYSHRNGVALLPNGTAATQKERQRQFEDGQTTDDHCMAIVGLAHDQHGNRYFIMKNSLGKTNRYGGFVYVSEDYLRLKTIAVVLPK